MRHWLIATALMSIALATLVIAIAPRSKPVVTVYMHPDCGSCRRWAAHLESRGFLVQLGDERDWPLIRSQFRVMPGFQSSHTAVVDGLFIEGPVPAHDIHVALTWRKTHRVLGLIVPGVPRGSPGMDSPFPQPYTVFYMREGGLMQPFAVHDH